MKKLLSIICIVAMALTMLVSCNDHEHKFAANKWASDSDYHWHPCTAADGCKEKDAKEAHTFGDYIDDVENPGWKYQECVYCGHIHREESGQTGDNSMIAVAVAAISMLGIAVVVSKKKEF